MEDFLFHVFKQSWTTYIWVLVGAEALLHVHRKFGPRSLLVAAGVLVVLVTAALSLADSEEILQSPAPARSTAATFFRILLPAMLAIWKISDLRKIQVQIMVIGAVAAATDALPIRGMLVVSCLGLPPELP